MAVPDNRLVSGLRHALEYLGAGDRVAPFPIRRLARPWTRDELPAAAAGLIVAPPDYVGVGTQKSGTSWWAGLIEEHPRVAPNLFRRKEMHYLTHFLETALTDDAIATYHAAFARPQGEVCGEWTPNYMASPYTLFQIRKAAPKARILVMMRDPIDRFESGFNHEYKQRFGGVIGPAVRTEVLKRYALRKESIWNGMYAAQMDVVRRAFDPDQVLVLQYEKCRAEPGPMIAKTYRFLGLDDEYRPREVERAVNVQRRVTRSLTGETRALLGQVYAADAQRLKAMYPDEIDLDLWTSLSSAAGAAA